MRWSNRNGRADSHSGYRAKLNAARNRDIPQAFCSAHNVSHALYEYRWGEKQSVPCPECAMELPWLRAARAQLGNNAPKAELIALAEQLAGKVLIGLRSERRW